MSIDSIYEDLIADLTKHGKIMDISSKLLSLTSNDERVLYVYDLMKDLNVFPKLKTVTKWAKVSTHYRNHGNKCFQKSDDYKAWQYYNLALLYAPIDSELYYTALSNRSAVFFTLKKYEECKVDIEKVFSGKCPNNLKDKLNKRLQDCKKEISKQKNVIDQNKSAISNILSFDGPKSDRFLCASTKLEVAFTETMGRHVIAKKDIKVGEILAQEEPYFSLVLKDQLLFVCSNCLSWSANLWPCQQCCCTLYCSQECMDKAWKDYHGIECSLMSSLLDLKFTKLELLALRTVIKARNEKDSWESLLSMIEEIESNMNTEFRGHVKIDGKWIFDSKFYPSIHTLETNVNKRSVSDIFQKSVTAAVFLNFLLTNTDFMKNNNIDEDEKIKKCVAGMLLLHVMSSPTNMHGISAIVQTASGDFVDEVSLASAPYAFHSLLNHSCAPNVVRFNTLGTSRMTLFALRPIKKGMQIFDNYGAHHALQSQMERVKDLKFQYKFICVCEACSNNWPTYQFLSPAMNLPADLFKRKHTLLSQEALDKLQKGDKDMALKLFAPLCKLAEDLEPYAPCMEIADCQESLKQCLTIFEGLVPYGYSKLVEWLPIPSK